MKDGLSEVADIALPKTVVELQVQDIDDGSALSPTSRVVQLSLVDFLR